MAEIKEKAEANSSEAADARLEEMMSSDAKRKKKKRRIIAGILAAAILWFGVRPAIFGPEKEKDTGYVNFVAEKRDITVSIGGSGALMPADSYNITSLISGDILSADFEEGDYVEKDQLLYSIDSSDAEKSISQAEIALENARLAYDSAVDSFDALRPSASISGRVSCLYVKSGDKVNPGDKIADIMDSDNMTLEVYFNAAQTSSIFEGQQAVVTMTGTGEVLYGSVSHVSGYSSSGGGGSLLSKVEIEVSNPGGITEGGSATARVGDIYCAQAGTFKPGASESVTAPAEGYITSVNVAEGQRVSPGTALVSMESDSAERQMESSSLNVRSAELSLENALEVLDEYSITAPISGTVVEKNLKAGDKLDGGSSGVMAVIYDMSYLTLTLNVDELDISSIELGQKVELEVEAASGRTYEGYVDRIGVNGTVADGVTTYPVRILVEDYEGLMPGMNASAEIIIEQALDVLTVPISAVNRGNTVLAVDPESSGDSQNGIPEGYRSVPVELGRSDDDYIEITSGLNEGDKVGVSTQTTSLLEQMMTVQTGAPPQEQGGGPEER